MQFRSGCRTSKVAAWSPAVGSDLATNNVPRRYDMEHGYTGRREDRRLVTGAGMFTADWDRPGVLHAAFLRTDRPHARIVSTDVAAARAAPGVRAVLTGADMQVAGYTRGLPLMPLGRGDPLKAIIAPALALGCVCYVGEPVAIVEPIRCTQPKMPAS
jgi:CO/xanthine dehydrogenase Mo-binding subunit